MICCYLKLVPLLKLEQTKTLKTHLEWIQVSKGGEDVLGFRLRTEPRRNLCRPGWSGEDDGGQQLEWLREPSQLQLLVQKVATVAMMVPPGPEKTFNSGPV